MVLKIIQHCEQEGGGPEAVQGNLLGLVDEANKRVEVTNSFPTPQRGDEEEEDSGQRRLNTRTCSDNLVYWLFVILLGSSRVSDRDDASDA